MPSFSRVRAPGEKQVWSEISLSSAVEELPKALLKPLLLSPQHLGVARQECNDGLYFER